MTAVASIQRPPIPDEARSEILALSTTASAVCESVADGGPWTFETLHYAAEALELGSPSFGLRGPHPRLAASLRRISAKWYVRTSGARL